MGIMDILKGAGNNPSPAIPQGGGYSKGDIATAKTMAKTLGNIEKMLQKNNKHWDKMAQARPLQKAMKSMKSFEKQQAVHNRLMRQGNVQMESRVKSYTKLAAKRKEAIDDTKEYNTQLNESQGMMGRLQNVLNEMPAGMSIFTAAVRDAGIVLGDMNQGFDIMARTGQAQGKTMGELAKSTGNYMAQMRMGSVVAAQFGVTAEESNAAFAKLTETYGGTGDAVDEMSTKWGGMAAMAKLSGLGMVDIANMADQGYKKLGETLDDTLNTVKDMTQITGDLNDRFGEGSVNSKAFASAIQEMAYGASFMNQNSRMLTETLGRELQMQLALGRAPEAAMKKAQANMELAGKVNLVGVTQFRDSMQAEWDALSEPGEKEAHLKKLVDEFGSEGELLGNMLEKGNLMSSGSLFAFEKAVQNSSALSAKMLEGMRASAAGGDVGALLSKGLSIQDAQYMVAEAELLQSKIKKVQAGGDKEAAAMFGDDWQKDEEAVEFVKNSRKKGAKSRDLAKDFYKMGGAGKAAAKKLGKEAEGKGGKQDWEIWADKNIGAAWFSGITNSFTTITALLSSLPISLAGVLGALLLRRGLAAKLGNLAMPGSTGAKGPGFLARQAGGISRMRGMANAGGAMGKMGRAGLYGAVAAGVGLVAQGMFNASEILGKADVSGVERLAAGFGNLISVVTGVDARDAAMGNTGFHKAIYGALGLNYLDGSNSEDEYANSSATEQMTAQYESRKARIAGGGEGEAMSREQYTKFMQQRGHRASRIAGGEEGLKQLSSTEFMNQERTAASEIDGNGDLILRVPGFRKDVAQANLDNLSEGGG